MDDLQDLYQQVILDHNKNPRNFGRIEHPDRTAEGHNPLCGDELVVDVTIEDDTIGDIRFTGSGCAISKSSASLMTEAVKGRRVDEANELFESVHKVMTGEGEVDRDALGKLAVFAGVQEFPSRVKCATLAWHTLHAALEGKGKVTTE